MPSSRRSCACCSHHAAGRAGRRPRRPSERRISPPRPFECTKGIGTMRDDTLSRREALGLLGAAGAATFVAFGRTARAASCTVTPAETEGPYFVDERLQRSDLTADPSDGSVQAGGPLRLKLNVLRTDGDCAPAAGVQVDVWHANASGAYSDEAANGTVGRKFLRGYQVTDTNGAVAFTTIYPGWYPGRTIHIHVK